MAEPDSAQRAGDKSQAKSQQGIQRLGSRVTGRKEHLANDQRSSHGIDIKIVELDGSADKTGKRDVAQGRGSHAAILSGRLSFA